MEIQVWNVWDRSLADTLIGFGSCTIAAVLVCMAYYFLKARGRSHEERREIFYLSLAASAVLSLAFNVFTTLFPGPTDRWAQISTAQLENLDPMNKSSPFYVAAVSTGDGITSYCFRKKTDVGFIPVTLERYDLEFAGIGISPALEVGEVGHKLTASSVVSVNTVLEADTKGFIEEYRHEKRRLLPWIWRPAEENEGISNRMLVFHLPRNSVTDNIPFHPH